MSIMSIHDIFIIIIMTIPLLVVVLSQHQGPCYSVSLVCVCVVQLTFLEELMGWDLLALCYDFQALRRICEGRKEGTRLRR